MWKKKVPPRLGIVSVTSAALVDRPSMNGTTSLCVHHLADHEEAVSNNCCRRAQQKDAGAVLDFFSFWKLGRDDVRMKAVLIYPANLGLVPYDTNTVVANGSHVLTGPFAGCGRRLSPSRLTNLEWRTRILYLRRFH